MLPEAVDSRLRELWREIEYSQALLDIGNGYTLTSRVRLLQAKYELEAEFLQLQATLSRSTIKETANVAKAS